MYVIFHFWNGWQVLEIFEIRKEILSGIIYGLNHCVCYKQITNNYGHLKHDGAAICTHGGE